MIPGFKLTDVGGLLRPSLRIQEEDHIRAERHMREILATRRAKHQQLYGIAYPNTNVPLVKSRPFRVFDLSLHQSVTHDILYTLRKLYGDNFEYINWNISLHNFFDAPSVDVEHVNEVTWKDICPEMIQAFQEEYDALLKTVDLFIVGHAPVLAMLYEPYGKPILILNTCRYDQPFCWEERPEMKELFHQSLHRMIERRQAMIVSNNRADHHYLKTRTGLGSIYIPSLCLYQQPHTPTSDVWLMYAKELEEHLRPFSQSSTRLFPRPFHFEPSDLVTLGGVIHLPYETSTMSTMEHYMSGLPILVPSKEFLSQCIQSGTLKFIVRYDKPDEILSQTELDIWLQNADYYLLPNIQTYDSFEDCVKKVNTFQDTDREKRLRDIQEIREIAFANWRRLLDPYLASNGI